MPKLRCESYVGSYQIDKSLVVDPGPMFRAFTTEVVGGKVVNTPLEPKERITRRGLPIVKWELYSLAVIWSIYTLHGRSRVAALFKTFYSELVKSHEEKTGYPVTDGAIRDRVDKGHREKEFERYSHLVPAAMEDVRRTVKL